MGACQTVRMWITANVLMPVMQFISEAREVCEEIGQWVEENVTKPVEKFIHEVEEFCHDLPWPFDWVCDAVTVVVKVIEWVVETVLKWVVIIVCQVVTFVIGLIVEVILRVLAWLVQFFVCLFTDPLSALASFYDLWNIILDVVGDVFDFVGLLLDDVIGILDDIERLIDSIATSLGWLGVILGLLKGLISLIRRLVEIIRDAVKALKDIILGILNLNLCRIIRGGADLGTAILRVAVEGLPVLLGFIVGSLVGLVGSLIGAAIGGVVRAVGLLAGGVRDSVQLKSLEQTIEGKIRTAFAGDDARIERSLAKVNLFTRTVGLGFKVDARRMFLSSKAKTPDLRALHNDKTVDLYALAGYASFCDKTVDQVDGEVVYAGTDLRVSCTDLATYLAEGPDSVPEFHVFPITRTKFRDFLEIARKKARFIGVQLTYPSIGKFQIIRNEWIPLATQEFEDSLQENIFSEFFGRTGDLTDDLTTLPALAHFGYYQAAGGLRGLTTSFRSGDRDSSGITFRNLTPTWLYRWVPVHEMGHYWGLGHLDGTGQARGPDEIMFKLQKPPTVNPSTFYEYLLLGGEPRFTFVDIDTVWTWITNDARDSLLP